jgi:hypothetical protein
MSQAYYALQTWAAANEYRAIAPERTMYVRGGNDPHDESYITEILFPVERETRLDVLKSALDSGDLVKFTERARQVVDMATAEADARHQPAVGIEHLLIGLLDVRSGFAAHALHELGVSSERIQQPLAHDHVSRAHEPNLTLDEPTRQVLLDAIEEARQFDHDYIGTEHILLGLTGEQAGALERVGTTANEVRAQVLRMLAQP